MRWHVAVALSVLLVPVTLRAEPGGPAEARALAEKSLAAYRALGAYAHTVDTAWKHVVVDADGEEDKHTFDASSSLVFRKPNLFRDEAKDLLVVCDGKTIRLHSPKLGQVVTLAAEGEIDLGAVYRKAGVMGHRPDPVLQALLDPKASLDEVLEGVTWESVEDADEDGAKVHVLKGRIDMEMFPGSDGVPFTARIGADDLLLRGMTLELTATYQKFQERQAEDDEDAGTKPMFKEATWRFAIRDQRLNEAADDKLFVFVPGAEDKEVRKFRREGMDPTAQIKLIGQPAPEFGGTALDGEPLALKDLRGKVVLLDFWATWCGPCVSAIPHIQAISEKYAEKGLAVVGINRDGEGTEEKVRKFLEKKKVTFRQFMDVEGDVAKAYKVTGIPCSVLIDTNGVIQDIHTGFGTGTEQDLAENIDKVLAGQPVHTAEELEAMIEESSGGDEGEAEEEEEDEEGGEEDEQAVASTNAPRSELEEVNGGRIQIVDTEPGRFSTYQYKEFDLDGDGQAEYLMPDWRGGINVVGRAPGKPARVRFKGLAERESLSDFMPQRFTNGVYWAVATTRYANSGGFRSSMFRYFDPQGQELWRYQAPVDKPYSSEIKVATGDVTGDGQEEIVLAVSVFKMKKTGAQSYTHQARDAYVVVLDRAGVVLALRSVGEDLNLVRVVPSGDGGRNLVLAFGGGEVQWIRIADGP